MNIISPINQLGYGIAGLNITKALFEKERVSLFVLGEPQVTKQEDASIVKTCIMNSQLPEFEKPCLRIWHQHDMSQFVGRGAKIGFPFFELDTFTDIEKHHLNSLDKLFVSSSWAKDVCTANLKLSSDNIYVVPLGVDRDIFKPSETKRVNKNTVFFNCGKWEVRKGHDMLVKIFNKAFDVTDNVELWMMCSNPFLTDDENREWKEHYKNSKLGSKIKFIPRLKSQEEVYNIMENTDCGIFPSRAEGWNLELLEILSCGKKAIASNVSAHQEFCDNTAVSLVDMPEKEKAHDNKWFFGQGCWSKFTDVAVDGFVEAMQRVYKDNQHDPTGINQAGIDISKKFSWQNTAEKITKYAYV